MEPEKKGSDCIVRGFVKSFRQQSRSKSKDSSSFVSLSVDNISVKFAEASGLAGTKLAPYLSLKIGSAKPTGRNTSSAKKAIDSEVAWDEVSQLGRPQEDCQAELTL